MPTWGASYVPQRRRRRRRRGRRPLPPPPSDLNCSFLQTCPGICFCSCCSVVVKEELVMMNLFFQVNGTNHHTRTSFSLSFYRRYTWNVFYCQFTSLSLPLTVYKCDTVFIFILGKCRKEWSELIMINFVWTINGGKWNATLTLHFT